MLHTKIGLDGSKKHGNDSYVIDLEEDDANMVAMQFIQGATNYPSKISSVMLHHLHCMIL
jgi:hypothetical protein